jgi:hypothetical protein
VSERLGPTFPARLEQSLAKTTLNTKEPPQLSELPRPGAQFSKRRLESTRLALPGCADDAVKEI